MVVQIKQKSVCPLQVHRLWRNIAIGAALLIIPALAVLHTFVPDSTTWTINGTDYTIEYFEHWRTYIWQLLLMVIPIIASFLLIVTLPKKKTPWYFIFGLVQMLAVMTYWAIWMVDGQRNVENHGQLLYILGSTLVIAFAMIIRNYRKLTYREKNLELIKVIEEIEKEDLPAFFSFLMDVDIRIDTMEDSDHIEWWKNKLHKELDIGKQGVGEALTKLDKYKKKLQ